MDECGLEESIYREYARSPQGQRIVGEKSGKRVARTSIIAGLNQGKPLAPWTFQGYCNTEVILIWLEKEWIPQLKVGLVIIWDNASFHLSTKFNALIEAAGCRLLFLPSYSPDLNPIEKWWAKLKARIRKIRQAKMTISEALTNVFNLSH